MTILSEVFHGFLLSLQAHARTLLHVTSWLVPSITLYSIIILICDAIQSKLLTGLLLLLLLLWPWYVCRCEHVRTIWVSNSLCSKIQPTGRKGDKVSCNPPSCYYSPCGNTWTFPWKIQLAIVTYFTDASVLTLYYSIMCCLLCTI